MFFLIASYTRHAGGNLSILIHIHQSFLEKNPGMKFPQMAVLENQGYDGQFFYFLSRYIYDAGIQDVTIDSAKFRFLRIFPSLIYGIFPSLTGWETYAFWAVFVNILLLIFSFYLLYRILPEENKYLAYFYLFNPFSIISIILLIGDNLFLNLFVILIVLLQRYGLSPENPQKETWKPEFLLPVLIIFFLILTKETILFFLIPLFFLYRLHKNKPGSLIMLSGIIMFGFWLITVNQLLLRGNIHSIGEIQTHYERIKLPFSAFLIVLKESISGAISVSTVSRLLVVITWITLLFNISNFLPRKFPFRKETLWKNMLFAFPLIFIFLSISIVDYEYWMAFDNIYRIFGFSFLWILILKGIFFRDYRDYFYLFLTFTVTLFLIPRYAFLKKIDGILFL